MLQYKVFADKRLGSFTAVTLVLNLLKQDLFEHFGGATGNSPVLFWKLFWERLASHNGDLRALLRRQVIAFLDEYVGAFPSYYHWVFRNLIWIPEEEASVARGENHGTVPRFTWNQIHLPRGIFYQDGRIVNSDRLYSTMLETTGEWEERSEPSPDGPPPQIWIKESATHPVLREIHHSMAAYDALVRSLVKRLQILGIGVDGHLGFVERGAAVWGRNDGVMLVRLAPSTLRQNAPDFSLQDKDGECVQLEPARYAITQGIGTILSAGSLLLFAWGKKKQQAVRDMFLGTPGPQNPAAWIQTHPNVTVIMDEDAFGVIRHEELRERGWNQFEGSTEIA